MSGASGPGSSGISQQLEPLALEDLGLWVVVRPVAAVLEVGAGLLAERLVVVLVAWPTAAASISQRILGLSFRSFAHRWPAVFASQRSALELAAVLVEY